MVHSTFGNSQNSVGGPMKTISILRDERLLKVDSSGWRQAKVDVLVDVLSVLTRSGYGVHLSLGPSSVGEMLMSGLEERFKNITSSSNTAGIQMLSVKTSFGANEKSKFYTQLASYLPSISALSTLELEITSVSASVMGTLAESLLTLSQSRLKSLSLNYTEASKFRYEGCMKALDTKLFTKLKEISDSSRVSLRDISFHGSSSTRIVSTLLCTKHFQTIMIDAPFADKEKTATQFRECLTSQRDSALPLLNLGLDLTMTASKERGNYESGIAAWTSTPFSSLPNQKIKYLHLKLLEPTSQSSMENLVKFLYAIPTLEQLEVQFPLASSMKSNMTDEFNIAMATSLMTYLPSLQYLHLRNIVMDTTVATAISSYMAQNPSLTYFGITVRSYKQVSAMNAWATALAGVKSSSSLKHLTLGFVGDVNPKWGFALGEDRATVFAYVNSLGGSVETVNGLPMMRA